MTLFFMFLWKVLCHEYIGAFKMEVRGQYIQQVLKAAHISVPKLTIQSKIIIYLNYKVVFYFFF